MRFPLFVYACAMAILSTIASARPVHAQEAAPPPAHISFVEGAATLDHDGESEPAVLNMPVLEGDRIRTQTAALS